MLAKILMPVFMTASLFSAENFKPAASCSECHEKTYQDWLSSMHAQATPQKDPLFKGMYELAVKDSKGKLKTKCVICHMPFSSVFQSIEADNIFNQEGVTCQFCHGIGEIIGFHSANDVKIELDTIYSHQPALDNDAHRTAHREYYQKSEFCLPCHAEMKNPADIEVCSTGNEWRQYYEKTKKDCQDCHMPQSTGSASHRFPGAHQNQFLSNFIDIRLQYDKEKQTIQVTLINNGAGHELPTGTPLRMISLKLVAFNKEGAIIWENWKENPIQEDKSALFMRILGDAEGNGPVPPWKATQTLYNRRLMPADTNFISYQLSNENIYDMEARLLFHFAPPPLLKKFKITDPHFTKPKLIGQKGIKISAEL